MTSVTPAFTNSRHINLGRTFLQLETDDEVRRTDDQDTWANFERQSLGDTWETILKFYRVIILAEGGSGKSWEMKAQADTLRSNGCYAFYADLIGLVTSNPTEVWPSKVTHEFQRWFADQNAEGWFFLDARDELSLTHQKLETALQRFARMIDGRGDRARIIISSRASDWRDISDRGVMESLIPESEKRTILPSRTEGTLDGETKVEKKEPPRVYKLEALSLDQVKKLATEHRVDKLDDLIAEIKASSSQQFVRRPLDAIRLFQQWNANGKLGTLRQLVESDIDCGLLEHRETGSPTVISRTDATKHARKLALALVFCRKTLIALQAETLSEDNTDALDGATVLSDVPEEARKALLGRGLFDVATYGRTGFHHRSAREYLAASKLCEMNRNGLTLGRIHKCLFADQYGMRVTLPSMRPIAAWLALDDASTFNELVTRDPEVLLSNGDPGSLSLEQKKTVLRCFATKFKQTARVGMEMFSDQIERLADPALEALIRELWTEAPEASDVTALLVRIIGAAKITSCADLCLNAASNSFLGEYERVIAIRELAKLDANSAVAVADSILSNSAAWPTRVIFGVIEALYPDLISTEQLVDLIVDLPEPESPTGGMAWQIRELASTLDPGSADATYLRDCLAGLIWHARDPELQPWQVTSKFDYLSEGLEILVTRQLAEMESAENERLCISAAIAILFNEPMRSTSRQVSLRSHFSRNNAARTNGFLAEAIVLENLFPEMEVFQRGFWRRDKLLLGLLTSNDADWLTSIVTSTAPKAARALALAELVELDDSLLDELVQERFNKLTGGDPVLRSVVEGRTSAARAILNSPKSPILIASERQHQAHLERAEEKKAAWQKWHDDLVQEPAAFFTAETAMHTIRGVYSWMRERDDSSNKLGNWRHDLLETQFSPEVARRCEDWLKQFWRTASPKPWSHRQGQELNMVLESEIFSLIGLGIESTKSGWALGLSGEDARKAATFAMLELNGLPEWLSALTVAHPSEVASTLKEEFLAQIAHRQSQSHLPLLQALTHADKVTAQLLLPAVLAELNRLPAHTSSAEEQSSLPNHIDRLSRIISTSKDQEAQRTAAAVAIEKVNEARSKSELLPAWLEAATSLDLEASMEMLTSILRESDQARFITLIAKFFDGFGSRIPILRIPAQTRAPWLAELVALAYKHVAPAEDWHHEGVYTPTERDQAEYARSFLLNALFETPGPKTTEALIGLAQGHDFKKLSGFLKERARQRAAEDAEFPAITESEAAHLFEELELPTSTREGLFRTMLSRLAEIQDDLQNGDFSDRVLLRQAENESQLQATLALRLHYLRRKQYTISREEQVANRKKTDIRLTSSGGGHRAVIEVKREKYTLPALRNAVKTQLIDQYLRHGDCSVGCLLIVNGGRQKSWGRQKFRFEGLIEHLRVYAKQLELQANGRYLVEVIGLDIRDK